VVSDPASSNVPAAGQHIQVRRVLTSEVFLVLVKVFRLGNFEVLHGETIPLSTLRDLLLHLVEYALVHPVIN
jgi:hypothetical protein